MQRSFVVSTCGTSILTNGAVPEVRTELTRIANSRRDELSSTERDFVESHAKEQHQRLLSGDLAAVRKLSAELNGVLGFYADQPEAGKADQHCLLHTDTFQGELVAEMIRKWLTNRGLSATCFRVPELTTANLEAFHAGMNELVSWADSTLPGYRDADFRITFNLVGGFKSIQGFMQTLGMFYADETIYIFESGHELLKIPRLPIDLDQGARDALRQNLQVIRQLDAGLRFQDPTLLASVPETCLYRFANEVDLSAWGRLVWKQHKPVLYRERPLESLSPLLVMSPKTIDQAQVLPPARRAIFNERMDDLAVYLERDRTNCPKRLDFKQLKGNPCPPATHECDLWSDADTQRAFGRSEGKRFIVEWIGPALH